MELERDRSMHEDHEGGLPMGNMNAVRDITKRERTEEGLRESEANFRLLFTAHPHPMWVYDLQTLQLLEVNNAAIAHYGYARDEFLQMRITDIQPAQEVSPVLEQTN